MGKKIISIIGLMMLLLLGGCQARFLAVTMSCDGNITGYEYEWSTNSSMSCNRVNMSTDDGILKKVQVICI
jgi:hypothetical protein